LKILRVAADIYPYMVGGFGIHIQGSLVILLSRIWHSLTIVNLYQKQYMWYDFFRILCLILFFSFVYWMKV